MHYFRLKMKRVCLKTSMSIRFDNGKVFVLLKKKKMFICRIRRTFYEFSIIYGLRLSLIIQIYT